LARFRIFLTVQDRQFSGVRRQGRNAQNDEEYRLTFAVGLMKEACSFLKAETGFACSGRICRNQSSKQNDFDFNG
jgi:hypothetical protein